MPRHDEQQREVRSADPSLSPETNQRLTEELREAVGSDRVAVPADRPDERGEAHGTHSTAVAAAGHNRAAILTAALVLLVVGAIVAITTGSWWIMAAAVVLDVIAVGALLATTTRMTTAVEHPSANLAARMEDEGVADPDGLMTELVDEFSEESGETEEREVTSHEDSSEATSEQRSAVTPSSERSRPAGPSRRR